MFRIIVCLFFKSLRSSWLNIFLCYHLKIFNQISLLKGKYHTWCNKLHKYFNVRFFNPQKKHFAPQRKKIQRIHSFVELQTVSINSQQQHTIQYIFIFSHQTTLLSINNFFFVDQRN